MAFWSKNKNLHNIFNIGSSAAEIRSSATQQVEESFSKDRFTVFVYLFCFVSVLAQSSLILVSWGKLPPEVPIFYSKPWGATMLTSPIGLWILPGLLLVLSVLNFLVISNMRENSFLAKTVVIFTFLVGFLTIYGLAKIISLLI